MRHERSLLALALLLGALLRLPALGAPPLGAQEAAHAWRAARAAAEGEVVSEGTTSAFLLSASGALFTLVEPSAFLARLPSALCGLALVAASVFLRDAWGSTRAVALAILLAVDPGLIRFSRDASGVSAGLLAAALAAIALLRWSAVARSAAAAGRRWAVLASAAAGVLVTTGVEAWSLAPLLGLVGLARRPWKDCPPPARHCGAAFAASALLAATAGLWALPWAGVVSASLTEWLARFAGPLDGAGLRSLARSQPLTILLAAIGVARSGRSGGIRPAALVAALAWGVFVAARAADGSAAALSAVLAVCAADGVGALAALRWPSPAMRTALAAGAAALAVQAAATWRPLLAQAPVAAAPDLDALAADLERIAVQRGREARELPVLVLGEPVDPRVAWALRRMRRLSFAETPPAGARDAAPVLVAPATEEGAPAGYAGAAYAWPGGKVNLWVPLEP